MKAANEALENADEDVAARARVRRDEQELPTHQELLDELSELDAQLGCMGAVSPIVLEAYNKRKVEVRLSLSLSPSLSSPACAEPDGSHPLQITDQQTKLDSAQERLDESQQIITTTENLWRPRLDRLISDISAKFTAAFDSAFYPPPRRRCRPGQRALTLPLDRVLAALGLVGEVRLATEDDYEKWGIEIMVSFRDRKDDSEDVTLHVLSGQRQSGGVRPPLSPAALALVRFRASSF